MQVNISFDPSTELEDVKDLIAKLEGEAPEAPAAKAAPARKTAAKKAAPAKAAEPEEEPEEETDSDDPTLEDCIARAQELVGEKRTQEVKDAVAEIGVERVSKLKTKAQFKKFLELVADDADTGI
jgi:hypothetical protein